jgi:hypothetical protein
LTQRAGNCAGRGGARLEPKVYLVLVLVYLVQHAERMVTQRELLKHGWPDIIVEPIAIARNISNIRRAVGDQRKAPRVIQTFHRRQHRTGTLTRLLNDAEAWVRLLSNPARELYDSLSPREQLIMQALAVYDRPVPATAIRYMLPALPVDDLLDSLVRNYAVAYDHELFSLHPLDQRYAYGQLPEGDSDYSKPALHTSAAEFFHTLQKPQEAWQTIED